MPDDGKSLPATLWSRLSPYGRIVLQLLPDYLLGGAFAQAWSEYEGSVQSARVEEFMAEFSRRVQALDDQVHVDRQQLVQRMGILERGLELVAKTHSPGKRRNFATIVAHGICSDVDLATFEGILDQVDAITDEDLAMLVSIGSSPDARHSVRELENAAPRLLDDRRRIGHVVGILAKLEARGLIGEEIEDSVGMFEPHFPQNEDWQERWRKKWYVILPLGSDVLGALR
jgi:hypothetical protein